MYKRQEYSYLFWEGENNTDYDFSKGFCVAGADTADFLREKLAEIGLTPVSYTHLDVYKRQDQYDINLFNQFSIVNDQVNRAMSFKFHKENTIFLRNRYCVGFFFVI